MKKYILLLLCLCLISCKEENILHPYGHNDGIAPGEVTNIRVTNLPGAADIIYDLPDDIDLQYVKAVYTTTKEKQMEVRASGYINSLRLDGFGKAGKYDVTIYTVDSFENISKGVTITVEPLTPPVELVRNSLTYFMDFGGFLIDFKNENEKEIAIYALKWDDESNEYIYHDAMYTSTSAGRFAVRGLPNVENRFCVYVRDRYDNISDSLFFEGTPIKEDYLDKKLFKEIKAPGDAVWTNSGGAVYKLWDDTFFVSGNMNHAHTNIPTEFPHRLTIDLGVTVKLSRMKEWQRSIYEHGSIKRFRMYGCQELPASTADNPLEGWTLLGEFESVKPSGLPLGQTSDEDVQMYHDGEEFSFVQPQPEIRYVKLESLESWSGMLCTTLSELSFWGSIIEIE